MSDEFNNNNQGRYTDGSNEQNMNVEHETRMESQDNYSSYGNNLEVDADMKKVDADVMNEDDNLIKDDSKGVMQAGIPNYEFNVQAGMPSVEANVQTDKLNFESNVHTDPFNTMNDGSNQTNNSNPYPVYPNPIMNETKKARKKRKVPGVFKLTAAALAFGIISGAAFQGYYLVMDATGHSIIAENKDIKVASVAQNSTSNDTISTTSTANTVVSDVSDVVDKAMPSIVAINAKITSTGYDIFGRGVSEDAESSGSGFIIAQNNSKLLIATNNHVVDGATSVKITFSDKSTAEAEIKGSDANADLAVLSVNMDDLKKDTISAIKVATLGDSDKVQAGDTAIAIGNALGYGQSVTVGVISAVNREVQIDNKTMKLLQTDAAINPGNSGGALLNTKGQVIGINSVKYADTEVEGMGYAIPISNAIPMINELMNREAVSKSEQGFLGINAQTAQSVTEEDASRFNLPVGIYVNDVIKGSPAEKAGLKQGDVITGIDDIKISSIDDLINALSYKKAGEKVKLKIQEKQNGEYAEKTLDVTLGKK